MASSYEVRSGDTLSDIASVHGVKWQDIAKVNKLKNPNKIFPGNVLTIPTKQEPQQAAPEPQPKPSVPVKEVGRTDPYPDQPISVEVVQQPPASKASSRTTSEGSGPRESEAWGPGYSKSYPALSGEPGSLERASSMYEQMKYGDFWMDWLDQALPTAVQGLAPGTGSALIRAAVGLRKMASETEFSKLPSSTDPMAKWLFKNMKYFDRTNDPNYKKIDPMSERRMDEVGNRPLAMNAKAPKGWTEVEGKGQWEQFVENLIKYYEPRRGGAIDKHGNVDPVGNARKLGQVTQKIEDILDDNPLNSSDHPKSKEKP